MCKKNRLNYKRYRKHIYNSLPSNINGLNKLYNVNISSFISTLNVVDRTTLVKELKNSLLFENLIKHK